MLATELEAVAVDTARDAKTLKEVVAEDLLRRILDPSDLFDIATLESMSFICSECSGKVNDIACRSEMDKVPHFRIVSHKKDCQIDGYEKLVKRGKEGKVSNHQGFPVSYPNFLRISEFHEVIADNDSTATPQVTRARGVFRDADGTADESNKLHNRYASSIRAIVMHFISFPHDRHLNLQIPEVTAKTYAEIFRRIPYRPRYLFTDIRVYFGKLNYENICYESEKITFIIEAPMLIHSRPAESVILEVSIKNWTKGQIDLVKRDVDRAVKHITDKSSSSLEIWFFFLGRQCGKSKFKLWKEDRRLLHFEVSDTLEQERYVITHSLAKPILKERKPEPQPMGVKEETLVVEPPSSDENLPSESFLIPQASSSVVKDDDVLSTAIEIIINPSIETPKLEVENQLSKLEVTSDSINTRNNKASLMEKIINFFKWRPF